MRAEPSVLHIDLDAFFAAVEQRDKPSLRGKPVIVGGTGWRGVVATASYEARKYGVRSAMSTREARARCPHAAFLRGRFDAYNTASNQVMELLQSHTPLVEPLSLDEAFVDLSGVLNDFDHATLQRFAEQLLASVSAVTGGLTGSIGIASSKFLAKVASELDKPAGISIIAAGREADLLHPMSVSVIPGVGPATLERLRRSGVFTVADLAELSESELIRQLGNAHGSSLYHLARAEDPRPVVPEREAKSISVEGTYEVDLTDRKLMVALLAKQAESVANRLVENQASARTITIKVRLADFTTMNRSRTLPGPTDSAKVISQTAAALLAELDLSSGVRLLGCGVSSMTDWIQDDLFELPGSVAEGPDPTPAVAALMTRSGPSFAPGADVRHQEFGRGWVWGSGKTTVTVRFETAETGPGPVRSFALDDPALSRTNAAGEPLSP